MAKNPKILEAIMKGALDTELELMREGSIPDFLNARQKHPEFIKRAQKVVKQETGVEPPNRAWCGDHLKRMLDPSTLGCRQCGKKGIYDYWN